MSPQNIRCLDHQLIPCDLPQHVRHLLVLQTITLQPVGSIVFAVKVFHQPLYVWAVADMAPLHTDIGQVEGGVGVG